MMTKMTPDQAQVIAMRDQLVTYFRQRQDEIEDLAESQDDLISAMARWILRDLALDADLVFLNDDELNTVLRRES